MPELMVLIASTRPGRVGLPVGEWFAEKARRNGRFDVQVADLAVINLPFMDEPNHPIMGQYTKPHTRAWSEKVKQADAFAFVMPEYNFSMAAPLKNALDFLAREWHYKPVGFVSYGGISGGTRAVQEVKHVVTTLKMMPVAEAVNIPFVREHMVDGQFTPAKIIEDSADAMLGELERWEKALRPMRNPV